MFWQANAINKQTSKTNQTANSSDTTEDSQQQQQLNEAWKEDGDGDSGLEDGAQADSPQQNDEAGERSLTTRVLSKKPILKSVMHAAKQTASARPKLAARVPAEKKLTVTSIGAQGRQEQTAKKSIWERLGNKVGGGKQAITGRKVITEHLLVVFVCIDELCFRSLGEVKGQP